MTNRDTSAAGRKPESGRARQQPDSAATPATDLQPEDAGTAASGTSGTGDDTSGTGRRRNAAETAMKQFAKTDAEGGARRGDAGR